jgi:hypothetical protein
MGNDRRNLVFNILTYAVLVATLGVVVYYALIGFGIDSLNPFPPDSSPSGPILPGQATNTPTPTRIATWTPTPIPTETPIPPPTNTRLPTLTPSVTPTFPPPPPTATFPATSTPTPRVTRSADWPFTCEVQLRRPEYGNPWTGVAGQLQDLDGNPLPGYLIRVEGPIPNLPPLQAGADQRINAIYGNEAAWEQAFNPGAFQEMEVRVQVFVPVGENLGEAASDVVTVNLRGYASSSLGFVICTLNWDDWPAGPTGEATEAATEPSVGE